MGHLKYIKLYHQTIMVRHNERSKLLTLHRKRTLYVNKSVTTLKAIKYYLYSLKLSALEMKEEEEEDTFFLSPIGLVLISLYSKLNVILFS